MRLVPVGAVAYSSVYPLIHVGFITDLAGPGKGAQALLVTALYFPLYARHVLYAARGSSPPGGVWTLAAIAVVVIAAMPVLGPIWLTTLDVVAVAALITLRSPWSLAAVAGVVATSVLLVHALDDPIPGGGAYYYPVAVLFRAASVIVPIWLVGAIRRLHDARVALAEEAVVRERLRIDDELRRTLGTALGAIAAEAQQASALLGHDPAAAEDELHVVVDGSRRTLAEVRKMIHGYQRASPHSQLDTAVTLLTAAGIETRVVLPPEGLPATADEALETSLRSATAQLLRDDRVRGCTIEVSRRGGQLHIDLHRDATTPSLEEATAR